MYQRRPRRFKRRSNGRGHQVRGNGDMQRLRADSFSNDQNRNRFRPPQSAEKLFEKYNTLAKEALSSGDKTLSENYLQHADHFMRIIEDKNKIQNQRKIQVFDKTIQNNKDTSKNIEGSKGELIEEKKDKNI
jgi:hypothetical protein